MRCTSIAVSAAVVMTAALLPSRAHAETYYVDRDHAAASDANPGTESEPWATISHAVGTVFGGDEVIVKAGVYTEMFNISGLSGTDQSPTIIRTHDGDAVVIQGHADLNQGVTGGRLRIQDSHYLTFRGFAVRHMNQGIFVEAGASYVTIEDCEVYDVGQEAIHVRENCDHVTIDGCTIHDTRRWQYNGEGVYIGTGSAGPEDNSSFITVRNSTLYNIFDEAIELKAGTHDCLVEGNTIYDAGENLDANVGIIEVNQHAIGVQFWGEHPDHVIRGNIIHHGTGGSAIRAGTGCAVYNNVIYDIPNYGILVNNASADSYTRLIFHNTIDLVSSHAVQVQDGDADIRNNIGPDTPDNLAASAELFVSTVDGQEDYHLVPGAAAIDVGVDLTAEVPTDLDGVSRPVGVAPDLGAYEYHEGAGGAGTGGSSTGGTGAGGSPGGGTAAGGSGPPGGQPDEDGDCGCRAPGRQRSGWPGVAVALLGLAVLRPTRRATGRPQNRQPIQARSVLCTDCGEGSSRSCRARW
jgi:hypothetical protein